RLAHHPYPPKGHDARGRGPGGVACISIHAGSWCTISGAPREGLMAVTFTLNGKATTVNVDPQMPLLWVLRDTLNMTGTKFGCGVALCGACTVHIDGEPARSCITAISSVQERRSPRSKVSPPTAPTLFRKRGLKKMCRNAATANRGRSCLPWHCWPKNRSPRTPKLTMP